MVTRMPNRFLPISTLLLALPALAACSKGPADKADAAAPASSAAAAASARDGGVSPSITAPLPEPVLGGIVGCWQLGDLETWNITRTPEEGAQVVRTVSARGSKGMPPDYVRRAAVPSDVQYDAHDAKLAFDTAGPKHGLLFVFEVTPTGLAGSWFAARSPGNGNFQATGNSSALKRCAATVGEDGGAAARPPG